MVIILPVRSSTHAHLGMNESLRWSNVLHVAARANWYAYDFEADYKTECSEETWNMLPETEEEAIAKRMHFIKGEKEICEVCDGEGEVEYEPNYDDYDED